MNPEKIIVIKSKSTDPYYNLAYEEYLLNELDKEDLVILFYKNHNTIVIGRNQNPWHETAHDKFIKQRGKLARRFSGGGTVFHDSGNLNFSFLTSKNNYDLDWNFNIVQETLNSFNIESQLTERYDLFINQFKFSGNAFHLKKDKACHHGTLLLNSDLKNISRYLKSEIPIIEGNYISSNPSSIINLSEYNSNINANNFIEKFINVLKLNVNNCSVIEKEINPEFVGENKKIYLKNKSWDWIYGRTPNFITEINNKYISLKLKIEKGYIKNINVNILESEIINGNKAKLISFFNQFLLNERFYVDKVHLLLNLFLQINFSIKQPVHNKLKSIK